MTDLLLFQVSSDRTIKSFDLNTYEYIRTFIGHEKAILSIDKVSDQCMIKQ